MPHWLDDAITTLTKEAQRWKHSHGDKADAHATAAAILTKLAEEGETIEEVKAHLVEPAPVDASPIVTDVHDRVEVVPPISPIAAE
jgi:hypothetical protein